MPDEPPPLPQPSRKRILPAFVLCFVIGAHRLYAGKYISGIVQLAWVGGSYIWMDIACKGLIEIVHSGPPSLEMMDRLAEWEAINGVPFAPMLSLLAAGMWVAFDAGLLLARKFTDGEGNRIRQWV